MYLTPLWVHNTAAILDIDRDTFIFGVGGRLRLSATVYVVAETFASRLPATLPASRRLPSASKSAPAAICFS